MTCGSIIWLKPYHHLLTHQQEKCHNFCVATPFRVLTSSFQVAFLGLGKEKLYCFLSVFSVGCCS